MQFMMNLNEIWREVKDWIHVAHFSLQWQTLVGTSCGATIEFWGRKLLQLDTYMQFTEDFSFGIFCGIDW
jgi:hypothetical protein